MDFTFKEKSLDPKIPWFYYSCRKHGVEKLFFYQKLCLFKWVFKKKGKEKGFSKKTFWKFFRVIKRRPFENICFEEKSSHWKKKNFFLYFRNTPFKGLLISSLLFYGNITHEKE